VAHWTIPLVTFFGSAAITAPAAEKTVMIDATYLKAYRTATSLAVKKEGANTRSVGPGAE